MAHEYTSILITFLVSFFAGKLLCFDRLFKGVTSCQKMIVIDVVWHVFFLNLKKFF